MEYRCVQCAFRIKTLYVQYSPGNIRLMKCVNCKAVADEYIECEIMILLIDLMLHKCKAYRHLLFNVLNQKDYKFELYCNDKCCCLKFILDFHFDDYHCKRNIFLVNLFENNDHEAFPQWESNCYFYRGCSGNWQPVFFFWMLYQYAGRFIYDQINLHMLIDVSFGNLMFLLTFLFATRISIGTSISFSRYKDLLLSILVSSCFKVFLISMMVWEFPSSVILIIDLFVLPSNIVALKVMTELTMNRCVGACVCAQAVKVFVTQLAQLRLLGH